MEDLKVVFYIVVAIVWMIYNNYKKVSEAAKKRDPSKPSKEIIEENWPKEVSPPWEKKVELPKSKDFSKKVEDYSKRTENKPFPRSIPARTFTRKIETLKREPIRKERLSANYKFQQTIPPSREGGNLQPSKLVHFEDGAEEIGTFNELANDIRTADFRQAIILAEVLQRPYI